MTSSPSHDPRPKLLVIALRTGRLANRLVLFANFIAYAEAHGHRVVNVAFHSYAHLFRTTQRDIYCRYPVRPRRSVFDLLPGAAPLIRKIRIFLHAVRGARAANERLPLFGRRVVTLEEIPDRDVTPLEDPALQKAIADARVVFAYGWRFRAPQAVEKHAEKVRAYFQPLEAIERTIDETLHRLRQRANIVIGVHIRQGDYRTWKDGHFFFEVSRYAAWMRELAAQFPGCKVAFLVCSDEARRPEEFPGLDVGLASGPPVHDLFALARCDFVFGPPSTFSQWASFHGKVPLQFVRGTDDHLAANKFRVSFLEEIP